MNTYQLSMRRKFLLSGLGATAVALTSNLRAQDVYPIKPIKILVGAGAGGPTDFTARAIGEQLSRQLGQPVVIENKPGAAGVLSMQLVSRATPDGYTLVWAGNSALAIVPYLMKDPGYDVKSMVPISLGCTSSFVLVAAPGKGFETLKSMVAYAKSNPNKLSFGSNGANGSAHLLGELLKTEAGFEAIHIPYKGGAEWSAALLGGNIDFVFDAPSSYIQLIRAGKVKALAVTGPQREQSLPEVPTMAELGIPSMTTEIFFGLVATPGTPASVVTRLADVMKLVLNGEALREALFKSGYKSQSSTPNEFRARIDTEGARFQALLKAKGVSPQ